MVTELKSPSIDSANSVRSVWAFFCVSAILSWAVWVWPLGEDRLVYLSLLGYRVNWPLGNLKLVIGNCLPGLLALVWARIQGKQQFRYLLSTLLAWRTAPKWYVLAVGIPCGTFAATMFVVLLILPAKIAQPPISVLILGLITMFLGPLWEEIAWRGFAFRKLQKRYSSLISSLIVGVFWAVWHIPLWVHTLNYLTLPLLLIICANLVAWSVIFTFLYLGSGQSLPVVVVLHGAYLTAQSVAIAAFAYGQLALPKDAAEAVTYGPQYLILIEMSLSVCLAVILGRRLKRVTLISLQTSSDRLPGIDSETRD